MHMNVHLHVWFAACVCSTQTVKERTTNPLDLELTDLWAVVWMLGTQPRASVRESSDLNCWAIFESTKKRHNVVEI